MHLKVDTGLSRGGCTLEGWAELTALARRWERAGLVEVRALWTHFVDADADEPALLRTQLALFDAAAGVAERAGLRPAFAHAANSGAALHQPEAHLDLVRLGIGLYGVEPVTNRPAGLRPAMTLETPVVLTKRVAAGIGVSYHHDYRTATSTTLALVPLGYADGIPRSAAGRAQVLMAAGVTALPAESPWTSSSLTFAAASRPGTPVIFGPGDRGEPTVAEWAGWAGTIPHEILTRLGRRVARRVTGDGGGWTTQASWPMSDDRIRVAVIFGGRNGEHRCRARRRPGSSPISTGGVLPPCRSASADPAGGRSAPVTPSNMPTGAR